jgi:hypothetical protein
MATSSTFGAFKEVIHYLLSSICYPASVIVKRATSSVLSRLYIFIALNASYVCVDVEFNHSNRCSQLNAPYVDEVDVFNHSKPFIYN